MTAVCASVQPAVLKPVTRQQKRSNQVLLSSTAPLPVKMPVLPVSLLFALCPLPVSLPFALCPWPVKMPALPVSLPFALCPSRHLVPFSLPVSPPFALCPSRHLIAFRKGRLAKASQRALWGVPLRAFVPPCDTSQSWILAGCI